jgi:hypothetical protein
MEAAMQPAFIKGLRLSDLFYNEAVKPILDKHFPDLKYSAGRLDSGSDVLGFDTPRSTDHGWGPRLNLFVSNADLGQADAITKALGENLPHEFHGYSTNFSDINIGNSWMQPTISYPICHGVSVQTVRSFFVKRIGLDPRDGLNVADWLTFPEQELRVIASGQVFHDGLGELEKAKAQLVYYPHDVWLYLLATQWRRIDQEEPFMGRCGEVGDELGSRIVAARLVRDLMRLCFLMERQYAPYSKWLGTAFSKLNCAERLMPLFTAALDSSTWQERETSLSQAYTLIAEMHNALGITPSLDTGVTYFHDRPFRVLGSGRFVEVIRDSIKDETVRRLPPYLGGVNQFVDSTDVLSNTDAFSKLKFMFDEEPGND